MNVCTPPPSASRRHYAANHFWGFFVPTLFLITMASGLSLNYSDPELQASHKRRMATFVGFLFVFAIFLVVGSKGRALKARAARHASAAHELRDLLCELKFQKVAGFVTGDEGETPPVDVSFVLKRFEVVKQAVRSEFPSDLAELFHLLKRHLQHWLIKTRVPKTSGDYRMLKEIAYNRAEVTVTHCVGWPFRIPSPKGAVKRVLRTVSSTVPTCLPPPLDCVTTTQEQKQ